MLTDEEWEQVRPLLFAELPLMGKRRRIHKEDYLQSLNALRHQAVETYAKITGVTPRSFVMLRHHHLSHFGKPCEACGHLLRTPEATYCANCGG